MTKAIHGYSWGRSNDVSMRLISRNGERMAGFDIDMAAEFPGLAGGPYLDTAARGLLPRSAHAVIEASHDAQVIATRGIGTTDVNDSILKAVNDRLLNGERVIDWSSFWRELKNRWGNNPIFRDYISPNQDSGTVFLRAYYRFLDALN